MALNVLPFADKAEAYPSVAQNVASGFSHIMVEKGESVKSDKHSSLFTKSVNYNKKSFARLVPGTERFWKISGIKIFSAHLTNCVAYYYLLKCRNAPRYPRAPFNKNLIKIFFVFNITLLNFPLLKKIRF